MHLETWPSTLRATQNSDLVLGGGQNRWKPQIPQCLVHFMEYYSLSLPFLQLSLLLQAVWGWGCFWHRGVADHSVRLTQLSQLLDSLSISCVRSVKLNGATWTCWCGKSTEYQLLSPAVVDVCRADTQISVSQTCLLPCVCMWVGGSLAL